MPRPTGRNRSSGHRSAGSSRSSSGTSRPSGGSRPSGSSRPSSGFGGPRRSTPPPPPPHYGAPPPPPPRRSYWRPRRYYNSTPGYSSPSRRNSLSSVIITIILIVIIATAANSCENRRNKPSSNYSQTQQIQVEKKQKIDKKLCKLTDYYKDELGYLTKKCEKGLEHFYKKTNIQPVVMTMDISKVSSYDDYDELCELYNSMFNDEAHFLFIIFGNKEGSVDWEYSYIAGDDAVKIMDDDVIDLLFTYIDDYYYESNVTDDELVSNSFKELANKIMK